METFEELLKFTETTDGGDQGLLNLFFNKWSTESPSKHLPSTYNLAWRTFHSYQPAYTRVVHFIGATKPWHFHYDASTCRVDCPADFVQNQAILQLWWDIFINKIHHLLTGDSTDLFRLFPQLNVRSDCRRHPDRQHQHDSESNRIDYLGSVGRPVLCRQKKKKLISTSSKNKKLASTSSTNKKLTSTSSKNTRAVHKHTWKR